MTYIFWEEENIIGRLKEEKMAFICNHIDLVYKFLVKRKFSVNHTMAYNFLLSKVIYMKKKRSVDLTENILSSIQQHKEFCEEEKISETCCPLLKFDLTENFLSTI
jgi:hypothetical protein